MPPTRRVASEPLTPFRSRRFLSNPSTIDLVSAPSQRDRTTLSRPPSNAIGFHGASRSRPSLLPPRRTYRFFLAFLQPDVLPKSGLAPVSADPAQTTVTTCMLLITRNPTEPLCWCLIYYRRRSPPGDAPYGLGDSSYSLHLVGLVSSTTSPIGPRHITPFFNRLPGDPKASEIPPAPLPTYLGDADHWRTATTPPTPPAVRRWQPPSSSRSG